MNGTTSEPTTNKWIIFIVVLTLAVNGTVGMAALGYCLVWKVEPNTALLTSFISLVTYVLGVISGMLAKTSPTETIKVSAPTQPPTPDNPMPVKPITSVADPVHTEEAGK